MEFKIFCKRFLILFSAAAFILSLQSWSVDTSYSPTKLSVKQGDTIISKTDSLYKRYIDSLFSLNLSLDSLRRMGLSEQVINSVDSLYKADSIAHIKVYTAKELKQMKRDSIRAYRDSVIMNMPRVLNTYVFDKEVIHTRMFAWRHNTYTNEQSLKPIDTTFNYHFHDLPFQREDLNGQYLGVSGSAALPFNYFLRESEDDYPFFTPYLTYTYRPDSHLFYNVKTPYTELQYTGTLFANREKGEDNIHILHTQNFTPKFNFALLYDRFGANGILKREKTDFRTLGITGNYLGERYVAEGGYLYSRLKRNDNGGVQDLRMIRDTTVDVRTIDVNLADAKQIIRRNTFFITQTYAVPIRWVAPRDSLGNKIKDTTSAAEGTTTFFGHYGEYTVLSRSYEDNIALTDSAGRALYNNMFFLNPTSTRDSTRLMRFENRAFIKVQPWGKDALVSALNAGLGHQMLSFYSFNPDYFISGDKNHIEHGLYTYFGAEGMMRKNLNWNALGKVDFAGYYKGSFSFNANISLSSWVIEKGIHLTASFHQSVKKPSYFFENLYSNHYIWENSFDKTSTTKLRGHLSIPKYNFEISAGYALLKNNIYLDSLGNALQYGEPMHIFSLSASKNFKLGPLHLENRILFQVSSKEEVVPLPKMVLNLRYYFQFWAVKNVLNVQLGADMTYNSKYYAQLYSPALGMFMNQEREKFGGTPYFDAFLNLQWKRACIFVKVENVLQGTPRREYFSTYGYIRPQRAFKLGIWWPFYIK